MKNKGIKNVVLSEEGKAVYLEAILVIMALEREQAGLSYIA